ncbi:hypothetical protein FOL46_008896, partial [Perkinsus olseni]
MGPPHPKKQAEAPPPPPPPPPPPIKGVSTYKPRDPVQHEGNFHQRLDDQQHHETMAESIDDDSSGIPLQLEEFDRDRVQAMDWRSEIKFTDRLSLDKVGGLLIGEDKPVTTGEGAAARHEGYILWMEAYNYQEQGILSRMQYYTREALLEDVAALQSSTSIWLASNISLIARHQQFIQEGCFLWELIHPQINLDEMERDGEGDGEGDDGMIPTSSPVFGYPIWNPNGRYIVKLFYDGKWRMIQVDDLMPVSATEGGGGASRLLLLPRASDGALWPAILCKALLKLASLSGYIDRITEFDVVSALTGWHRRALLNPSPHAISQELSSRHSLFLSIDNIPLHLTRRGGAGQRSILPQVGDIIHRLESIIVHHHHDDIDIDEEGEKEEEASSLSLSGGDERRRRRRQCHLLQLSKLESNMRPAGSVSGPLSRACRILVDNEEDSEVAAEEEEESLSVVDDDDDDDDDEVTASHDDISSSYSSYSSYSSRYSLSGASSSNIIIDRQQQQEEENAAVSLRIDARHLSILRDLGPDRARGTKDMIDKSRDLPEEDACWIDITALKDLGSYSIWSSNVITRDTIKLRRTQEDTQYIEIQMEIDVPAGGDALTTPHTDGVWFIAQLHTPPSAAAAMEGGTHDGVDSSSSAAAAAAADDDDDDDSVVVCIMKADGDDDGYTINGTIHVHSDIYRAAAAAAASSSSSCSTSFDDDNEEKPVLLLDITDHHPSILGYQCLSRTLVHSSTGGCMRIFAESREAVSTASTLYISCYRMPQDEGAILPGECIFRNVPLHNHHDYTLPPNGTYMLIIDTDSLQETIKSMKVYGVGIKSLSMHDSHHSSTTLHNMMANSDGSHRVVWQTAEDVIPRYPHYTILRERLRILTTAHPEASSLLLSIGIQFTPEWGEAYRIKGRLLLQRPPTTITSTDDPHDDDDFVDGYGTLNAWRGSIDTISEVWAATEDRPAADVIRFPYLYLTSNNVYILECVIEGVSSSSSRREDIPPGYWRLAAHWQASPYSPHDTTVELGEDTMQEDLHTLCRAKWAAAEGDPDRAGRAARSRQEYLNTCGGVRGEPSSSSDAPKTTESSTSTVAQGGAHHADRNVRSFLYSVQDTGEVVEVCEDVYRQASLDVDTRMVLDDELQREVSKTQESRQWDTMTIKEGMNEECKKCNIDYPIKLNTIMRPPPAVSTKLGQQQQQPLTTQASRYHIRHLMQKRIRCIEEITKCLQPPPTEGQQQQQGGGGGGGGGGGEEASLKEDVGLRLRGLIEDAKKMNLCRIEPETFEKACDMLSLLDLVHSVAGVASAAAAADVEGINDGDLTELADMFNRAEDLIDSLTAAGVNINCGGQQCLKGVLDRAEKDILKQHETATGWCRRRLLLMMIMTGLMLIRLEVTPVDDVRKKYHHDLDLIQSTSTLNDGRSMNTKEERSGWRRRKRHDKGVDGGGDDLVDPTHRDIGCSILLKGILNNIDHHSSFGDEEQESVDARSRAMIGMVENMSVAKILEMAKYNSNKALEEVSLEDLPLSYKTIESLYAYHCHGASMTLKYLTLRGVGLGGILQLEEDIPYVSKYYYKVYNLCWQRLSEESDDIPLLTQRPPGGVPPLLLPLMVYIRDPTSRLRHIDLSNNNLHDDTWSLVGWAIAQRFGLMRHTTSSRDLIKLVVATGAATAGRGGVHNSTSSPHQLRRRGGGERAKGESVGERFGDLSEQQQIDDDAQEIVFWRYNTDHSPNGTDNWEEDDDEWR